MNKIQFKSRKDASAFLLTKGIDTSDWSDIQWLKLNKGQGEIHIMVLAEAIWDAMNESVPKDLKADDWHIPFGDNLEQSKIDKIFKVGKPPMNRIEAKIQIATARCARVSYLNFEGEDSYEKDIKLHDMLLKSGHYSPFEHCAKAMTEQEHYSWRQGFLTNRSEELINKSAGWCNNFKGFIQYRKILENEKI